MFAMIKKVKKYAYIYLYEMRKRCFKSKLLTSINYCIGTILSFKFAKRAFINVRGIIKIYQTGGGTIFVDDFVSFSPNVMLSVRSCNPSNPAILSIGTMTHIGERTEIHCGTSIKIGKHVRIGWDCLILDRDYHATSNEKLEKVSPVIIEDNVWVGCRAIILKGVIVGHNAIVGAGSVVTKNVEPSTLVAGNPAKVKRRNLPVSSFPYMLE